MLTAIDLNQPIFFLWAGLFNKEAGQAWQHRATTHSENIEIILPLKGELKLLIDHEPVTIQENELFIIPAQATVHSLPQENQEAVSFYWLHFLAAHRPLQETDTQLQQGLTAIAQQEPLNPLNNLVILPSRFFPSKPDLIINQWHQLMTKTQQPTYTQRSHDFLTTLLLIAASDDYLHTLLEKQQLQIKKTPLIAEWIRVNLSKELSVAAIAHHFQLNQSYLSRLFKKEQGLSIKDYLLQLKLETAKKLLTTTQLTVAEVSDRAYFGDTKHFMKLFKEKTGSTPTQYREANNHLKLNTDRVDPSSPLPAQFGNEGVRALLRGLHHP